MKNDERIFTTGHREHIAGGELSAKVNLVFYDRVRSRPAFGTPRALPSPTSGFALALAGREASRVWRGRREAPGCGRGRCRSEVPEGENPPRVPIYCGWQYMHMAVP
jgi:hypothetical protein